MTTFDVSCVGFAVLDILGRPVTAIPEGGRADFIEEIRMTVAGTAAATAMDCAILGLRTRMVSSAGADDMGDFLISKMQGYGMDTAMMSRDPDNQTSSTILPVRPNGERPALHVRGSATTFTLVPEQYADALDAKIVHLGGTGLLWAFDGQPSVDFLKAAKAAGRTTTFDLIQANPDTVEKVLPLLPYIDYFIPSIEEAEEMAGTSGPEATARWFRERSVRNAILTLGGEGVYVDPEEGAPFILPAHDIEVVDTTGCGDSFTAGIITGLSKGWDLRRCARFASAVAAQVAMGLGSDGKLGSFEDTLHATETLPLKELTDA
ncbi:sugar kinase [Rhodovulum sulfidophilum]|uniref:carbohydrate kinase family protein n=1 Tax=Rhodovulum sulfidophilum TaxID=35806 RepID=UPI001924080B|nr:sugar kinase [Rhodovulum sulfidophilum]MBL3596465.1 sugar kinase [Rhodovulum sulfidophilum]